MRERKQARPGRGPASVPRRARHDAEPEQRAAMRVGAGGLDLTRVRVHAAAAETQANTLGARMAASLHETGAIRPGPLTGSLRAVAEGHLGTSLEGVSLRADAAADRLAASERALAVTEGRTVSFAHGQLRGDRAGAAVLGHELTHVAQQSLTGQVARQCLPAPTAGGKKPAVPAPMDLAASFGELQPRNTRKGFAAYVGRHFGVIDVHTGTYKEQEALPKQGPGIPKQGWTSWDPGETSEVYEHIIAAFEQFRSDFGLPVVKRIIFFEKAYEQKNGAAVANSGTAGDFGSGDLTVYKAAVDLRLQLPRSDGSPGMDTPTAAESVARVISHELGHGVGEDFATQIDPDVFVQYKQEIGWFDDQELYDMGQKDVQQAFAKGQQPPKERNVSGQSYRLIIQPDNFDANYLVERPMRAYSLSGPGEDFADTVMGYVLAPELLRARSPRRYEFIRKLHGKLEPLLQTVPKRGDFPVPRGDKRVA